LQVNPKNLWSDVNSFLQALRENSSEGALALYRGDFLSGFHFSGSPDFESWMEDQRGNLRSMAANAARDLAHRAEGSRDLANAIHWWRKTLDLAPFDEKVLRRLMSLMAGSGNRGQAMSEFLRFRRGVANQLGSSLSQETLDLARRISDGQQAFDLEWIRDRRQDDPDLARRISDGQQAFDLEWIRDRRQDDPRSISRTAGIKRAGDLI
jgi:DNA-binding SARP family transcriptional activator